MKDRMQALIDAHSPSDYAKAFIKRLPLESVIYDNVIELLEFAYDQGFIDGRSGGPGDLN